MKTTYPQLIVTLIALAFLGGGIYMLTIGDFYDAFYVIGFSFLFYSISADPETALLMLIPIFFPSKKRNEHLFAQMTPVHNWSFFIGVAVLVLTWLTRRLL